MNVVDETEDGGKNIVRVPEAQQIQAQAGDLMAYSTDGVIPHTVCEKDYMPENADWLIKVILTALIG